MDNPPAGSHVEGLPSSLIAPPPISVKDKRIPGLDGLRAISISFVLFGHGFPGMETLYDALHIPHLASAFLGNGHLGVMIFFVISGYLITTLMKRELERTGTISLKEFYSRRAYRIFPAFYFYLFVIGLMVAAHLIRLTSSEMIVAGTYTWNYVAKSVITPNTDSWFLGHLWTLSIEEQFYLLWPLMLLWLRPEKASKLAITLIFITPFIRIASYFLMPSTREQLAIYLHTQWDPLMMGALIALWQGRKSFEDRIAPYINNKPMLLFACLQCVIINPLLHQRFKNGFDSVIGLTIEIFCIGFVMLHVTRNPTNSSGRFLNHPVVVFVGTLSYGLYLWQQLFLGELDKPWKFPFPINLVFVFTCALISFYLVEQPFLRLRHSKKSNIGPKPALPAT